MEDAPSTERDKLIIGVLADTGIRVGELVNLTTGDLIERDRTHYLRARGKTGERMVPIPRLFRRLQRFAEKGRPKDAGSDRLFITLGAAPAATTPRSPSQVSSKSSATWPS
ncbi:MAG TPA: tyrosine-type recombinase/integrase, partial [Candidatus Dormibacteraeota bacterium]|nr:tyrosine-type recombinase/integrase [Candidatus Dormibacteraeota bacterium]